MLDLAVLTLVLTIITAPIRMKIGGSPRICLSDCVIKVVSLNAKLSSCMTRKKNMFLPDRYVRGNCPRCDTANQPGDSCENCGAAYSPTELKNPTSALSGESPVQKKSLHYFLHLNAMRDDLRQWTEGDINDPMICLKKSRACKKRRQTNCANG